MEQEPRICPLCGSPVRLFYINFSEKVLMCEDANCDFPFGYEDLQIVTDESELRETFETASSISLGPYNGMSTASSVISTAAWSDIEKLNRIYDSEDCMADSRMSFTSDAVKKQRERRKTQKVIQDNLDYIQKLNTELNLLKHADKGSIQKENWLQNLMTLQGVSGRQLLKEEEIKKLKKMEPDFGMGELKININTVPNDIGLINIEIINEEKDCSDTDVNKIQIQLEEIEDMNPNGYNADEKGNQNNEKIHLANNQQAIILNEPMNIDSNIQGSDENENQVNNNIDLEDVHFNEINNLVTDSDIMGGDTNLVQVKTIVINNNSFTLIELKGAVEDINSQNETENIEGDIRIDARGTNTTGDTTILANEENIIKPNMSKQKEIESTQNHDTSNHIILTDANREDTILTNSNDNYLENRKNYETTECQTSAINKEINLSLETEKLHVNYGQNKTLNIDKTNTNSDTKVNNEINNELDECEKELIQEDTVNNSEKSDLTNSFKDQKDMMNNSKESDFINNSKKSDLMSKSKKCDIMNSPKDSDDLLNSSKESDSINSSKDHEDLLNSSKKSEDEVKIPKKRGRPKKGTTAAATIIKPNMSKQKESTQNHDTSNHIILTDANREDTILTNSNDNYLESRKNYETTECQTSAINKEINLSLETKKPHVNYGQNKTLNIDKTNTNSDTKVNKEINNESDECEKVLIQEDIVNNSVKSDLRNSFKDQKDMMNNSKESDFINNSKKSDLMSESKKTDMMNSPKDPDDLLNSSKESDSINSSKDQEDLLNSSKKSEDEVKIPKKRGRPKKGITAAATITRKNNKVLEQPLRRSSRLSNQEISARK